MQASSRRRDDLRRLAARGKARPAAPGPTPAARESIARTAADRSHADAALLRPTPGVGPAAAHAIPAAPPGPGRFATAPPAAAYAGPAPRGHRPGTSARERARLPKAGSARPRTALGLPALAAGRLNPLGGALYGRLAAAGRARVAALGACPRKRLVVAYGVPKGRAPFDPSRGGKLAP